MSIEYKTCIDKKFETVVADKLIYKVPAGAKFTGYKPLVQQNPSLASGTFYQLNVASSDKVGNYFIEEMTVVLPLTITVPATYTAGTRLNVRSYINSSGGVRADPINSASSNIQVSINGTPFNWQPTNLRTALHSMNYGARISDIDSLCAIQLDSTSNYNYLDGVKANSTGNASVLSINDGLLLQTTLLDAINNPFGTILDKTFGNMPRRVADSDFVFVTDATGATLAQSQNPTIVAANPAVPVTYYLKFAIRTPFWTPICAFYEGQEKLWSNVSLVEFQRTFASNATNLMFNFNAVVPSGSDGTLTVAQGALYAPIGVQAGTVSFVGSSTLYVKTYSMPDSIALNPTTQLTWYRYTNHCNTPIPIWASPASGATPSFANLVTPAPAVQVTLPSLQVGTIPKAIYLWCQLVDDGSKAITQPDAPGFYFTQLSMDINTNQGIFSQMSQREIYDDFSAKKNFGKSFKETQYITEVFCNGIAPAAANFAAGTNASCSANIPLYGQVLRIDADQLPLDWDKRSTGSIEPVQITIRCTVACCDNSVIPAAAQIYAYIEEESYMVIDKDMQVKQLTAPIDESIIRSARGQMPMVASYIHPMLEGGSLKDFWHGLTMPAKFLWKHKDTIGKVANVVKPFLGLGMDGGKKKRHHKKKHSYYGRGYDETSDSELSSEESEDDYSHYRY